jgi:O-methyltransferase
MAIADPIGKMKRALRRAMLSGDELLREKYPDFDSVQFDIFREVQPYTLTSPERIVAVIEATRYITRRRIPGAIVECGVWRGGSMMAAARTLQSLRETDRELYLFDTFEGMAPPTDRDVDLDGQRAASMLATTEKRQDGVWVCVSLEDVQQAVGTVGYPASRIHYVRGKVEDTIPASAPDQIALLRLDTDWYESTRHELEHLYPRLASGGVIIIDDYGHWKGARQATDEFIAATPDFGLLTRIDYTGRLAIKP